MPTPPTCTKTSLGQRLSAQVHLRWPTLSHVEVRFRGQFAYVTGHLPDGEVLPLCATAARPAAGASRSTKPATTTTMNWSLLLTHYAIR
ncbi:MAG: hypothetical protein LC799_01130, partial [Actinobacteria bacterium]|nr:hypothetical protein [Actinomycetota bacterium]